jgi:ABC-type multidrug transport system fused ATPase/permease subunit
LISVGRLENFFLDDEVRSNVKPISEWSGEFEIENFDNKKIVEKKIENEKSNQIVEKKIEDDNKKIIKIKLDEEEKKKYSVVIENGDFEWNEKIEEKEENTLKNKIKKIKKNRKLKKIKRANKKIGIEEKIEKQKIGELKNINIRIKKGELTAIVGPVGSGKSSLIAAILEDIEKKKGNVFIDGTIAYCAQQPWNKNSTIRENIIFGSKFEEKKYNEAIEVCCLKHDLEILTGHDECEIGERGVTISGGKF